MTSTSQNRDPDPVVRPASERFAASVELPMNPESAHQARHTVRELLTNWQVDQPDLRYDVLLLTSELVTNAVRHGADRVTLHVTVSTTGVEVAVEDGSPALPARRLRGVEDLDDAGDKEGGRGLLIISAVAEAWGVEAVGAGGKRVWARVRRATPVPEQRTS